MGGGTESDRALNITKEQKQIQQQFSRYLSPRIDQGLPAYEGPLYEPLSTAQIELLRQPQDLIRTYGNLPSQSAAAFEDALSGQSTQIYNAQAPGPIDDFLAAQRTQETARFEESTLPALREQLRGPGTYWRGFQQKELGKARGEFERDLSTREAGTRLGAMENQAAMDEAAKARQLQAGVAGSQIYNQALQAGIGGEEAIRMAKMQEFQVNMQE